MENKSENLKGAMWTESKSHIHWRGYMMVDGEKKYCVIIKSENDKGQEKYELAFSAGLIFVSDEDSKMSEKSPDWGGRITLNNTKYKFGAWNNVAKDSGNDFLGCSLQEVDEEKAPF